MKKKSLIMIALALMCIGVLSGTIAYFITTSTFNNEFASKPYSTKVTEYFISPDNWTPDTTTDKTVNVENTGEVPVAVRVKFEEKWTDSNGKELPLEIEVDGEPERTVILNFKNDYVSKWTLINGWYYYNNDLQTGEITSDLLESVTFNPHVVASANCVTVNNEVTCTSTGEGYDNATYVLTITIETVQADVKKEYWNMPDTLYETLKEQAYPDNEASEFVKSDSGINFAKNSSNENGKGLYMIADTSSDKYPIYYYRGAVNNNNVLFAELCWKIVRTTETGGVKLIYNGIPTEQGNRKICDNTGETAQVAKSEFNSRSNSPAYAGYKYGTIYYSNVERETTDVIKYGKSFTYDNDTKTYTLTDTIETSAPSSIKGELATHHYTCLNNTDTCTSINYMYHLHVYKYDGTLLYYITISDGKGVEEVLEEMFSNKNDSIIKSYIESTWYENSMTKYESYLEDTVWCNDQSYEDSKVNSGWNPSGGSINNYLYFDAYYRRNNGTPSLKCSEKDSLTVANGGVSKPVGLITSDEAIYAGGSSSDNKEYYLYTGADYWLMLPYYFDCAVGPSGLPGGGLFDYDGATSFVVTSTGSLTYRGVSSSYGVRPVISLKSNIFYSDGDGTKENPYIVTE